MKNKYWKGKFQRTYWVITNHKYEPKYSMLIEYIGLDGYWTKDLGIAMIFKSREIARQYKENPVGASDSMHITKMTIALGE